jgi:two-component system chemotaxis response regulator CheB
LSDLVHDVIVIGTSMGGLDALSKLVAHLPADLPAAVVAVLHIPEEPRSRLPEILNRAGELHAAFAVHGEKLEHGRVYLAPPDNHVMIAGKHLHVVRGPKENGHRPAVDPLFRSAAASYGPRVVGVILTGAQNCGTAGLMSIVAHGGLAIAQDPREAQRPDMPASAIRHVPSTKVMPLGEIGPFLERLARIPLETPTKRPTMTPNDDPGQHLQRPFVLTCPACHGALEETEVNRFPIYRCHVGHAFTINSLVSQQALELESALWAAVRSLQESETLARNLARRSIASLGARFEEKANAMKQHAEVILEVLLKGDLISERDGDAEKTG